MPLPWTTDPEQALANRFEEDRVYGDRIAAIATGHPVIQVDGSRTVTEIASAVE